MSFSSVSARVRSLSLKAARWNYFYNLMDGVFAMVAVTIVSNEFVVPAFLSELGASDTTVGMVLSVPQLLTFFIPLLIAPKLASLTYKKPFVLATGSLQRMPFVLMAVAAYALLPERPGAVIWAFAGIALLQSVANMLVIPAWSDLVAKVTPVGWRGSLFAWRVNIALVPVIASWWLIQRVMKSFEFPMNYVILFASAGAIFWFSLIFVVFLREPRGKLPKRPPSSASPLRQGLEVLRSDANFRRYMTAMLPAGVAYGMVNVFFILTAAERLAMPTAHVTARFMVISMLGTFVGGIVFGRIGDRLGHLRNFLTEPPLLVAACVVSIFARSALAFAAVFVLSGFIRAIRSVSGFTMIMEFGDDSTRVKYMAIYNSLFLPVLLAAPMAGGLLRDLVGRSETYVIASAITLIAWVLMMRVTDPRKGEVTPA